MSDYGIKTYADLAETCGGMVLANEIANRPLEPVSGDWAPWDEIFQWYIVQDPSFIMEHTDEPVFHDEELDLYVWGIRRHIRGLRPFHLLLCLSHNQPPPCSKSFSRNKKAPVETKEGQRRKALSISVSTGASCSLFRP